MADTFKDGILYMDEIEDLDLFGDILDEQQKEIEKKIEESNKSEFDKKVEETKAKLDKALFNFLDEIKEKNYNTNEFFMDNDNRIKIDEGIYLQVIDTEDGGTEINIIWGDE